jgi:hypothetical protein
MHARCLTIAAMLGTTLTFAMPVVAENDKVQAADPHARPSPARTIGFSGYNWTVKTSAGKVGPGPNYFSNSVNNVWVDGEGRLHLKITKDRGRWYSAEIVSTESFGYGTYRFYLESPVDNLDPNVVLGLFTWNDDPAYNHREIDIEFSRWGAAGNDNAQYVVQPYTNPSNILRFNQPAGLAASTHSFHWLAGSVEFESVSGAYVPPPGTNTVTRQWTLTGASPVAGGENARMNLWLFQGHAPLDGRDVEVIVSRFEFLR